MAFLGEAGVPTRSVAAKPLPPLPSMSNEPKPSRDSLWNFTESGYDATKRRDPKRRQTLSNRSTPESFIIVSVSRRSFLAASLAGLVSTRVLVADNPVKSQAVFRRTRPTRLQRRPFIADWVKAGELVLHAPDTGRGPTTTLLSARSAARSRRNRSPASSSPASAQTCTGGSTSLLRSRARASTPG